MKKENLLESRLQEIPKDIEEFVSLSFDVSDRIRDLLEKKGWSQKKLAKLLGKRESEVSKWLRGTHNFTLETIAKISIVLKDKLIYVPASTLSIDELKGAIKDFEVLCKDKDLEENFSNIKLTVLPRPAFYKKEDKLVFCGIRNDVNMERDLAVSQYNIAAFSSNSNMLCDETKTVNFLF